MQILVPFAAETPKTRLERVLSRPERSRFARAMLADVLAAIDETGHEPTVLSTAPLTFEDELAAVPDSTTVAVDERSLTDAVTARFPETPDEPVAVVMADLALATADSLSRLFAADADVAIAPGRGGGTNALVVRHPEFRADYHGASYLDHRTVAREVGAAVETVDSFRLGTDIDEPDDLVEVLVHGDGRASDCLRDFGFELECDEGRVGVRRAVQTTQADQ
ncbi:2-phospho-L-lactate guanylyltransferase [Natrialbaceae archaeon A-arb3/5]